MSSEAKILKKLFKEYLKGLKQFAPEDVWTHTVKVEKMLTSYIDFFKSQREEKGNEIINKILNDTIQKN
jgi:hypothetical protein